MQATPTPSGAAGFGATPGWGATPPNTKEADRQALSSFKTAFVIALVGTALSFLYPIALYAMGRSLYLGVPTAGAALNVAESALEAYFGIVIAGLIVAIVSFAFMRSGFARLRGIDQRFGSAPAFTVVAIVGTLMVALGLALLLALLVQVVSCTGTALSVPANCVSVGEALGSLALLGIGAIVLLVGGIGTIVGLWRLGNRYDNALFKVGAILLIFIGVVGAILLLIAAVQADSKVLSQPDSAFAVAPPVAPPPFAPGPPAQ